MLVYQRVCSDFPAIGISLGPSPMGPACGRRRHRALLIHHDGGLVDHVVQVDCGIILDLMA
jgi:hypothetical protein